MVYRFGNNLGLGPLPWLINGEIFSEEAKGVSSSMVTVTHWTSVFFVTRYATNLQESNSDIGDDKKSVHRLRDSASLSNLRHPFLHMDGLGTYLKSLIIGFCPKQEAISPSGTYFLFAAFAALAVLYVFALVPETKGKSPEEVKEHFVGQKKMMLGPWKRSVSANSMEISLVLYQDGKLI